MSTPNEYPGPEQSGSQPSSDGSGSQPVSPAPQQPNPGYQAPPPGYQQPAPAAHASFEMPNDWPKDMHAVMPSGGFSSLFKLTGLPQLLKVSYIIWLVTAGIWLLGTIIVFIASLFALGASDDSVFGIAIPGSGAAIRAGGVKGIITSIISLVLIAVLLVCLMKLKEGMQWARMVLSAIAVLSIVMVFFGAGGGLLGIVATILMWLPESSAWLEARSKGAPA